MSVVLIDTNASAWTLLQAVNLSSPARSAIASATKIYLSSISIFEITQKVRIGKWRAMSSLSPYLVASAYVQHITIVPLDATICAAAGSMAWGHKDPFDRMTAATALHLGCPVVSSDAAFDGIVAPLPLSGCRAAPPWSGRRAGTSPRA